MLASYTNDCQTNWDLYLPITLFAYRISIQQTTRESPFRLLYGRDPRLPSDLENYNTRSSFLNKIDIAWKEAQENIRKTADHSKEVHDSRYKELPYKVGDLIRVQSLATKVGLSRKLRNDIYKGPFKITRVGLNGNVEVDLVKERKWIHMNRIKPAEIDRVEGCVPQTVKTKSVKVKGIVWAREQGSMIDTNMITRSGRVSRKPDYYQN